MQNLNIAQAKAIERKNKERLLKVNSNLKDVVVKKPVKKRYSARLEEVLT